ncbi:MAG: hypothetical protein R2828_18550 [Saprospiraceae bacterium]
MAKTRNKIIITIIGILIFIIGFFGFAFHGMEIEDQYGDLQDFYFKSKSGDIMIFGDYEKIGLVDKTWKRIRIINSKKDTVDLYNWFNDDRYRNGSNKLYKVKGKISIDELEKEIIILKNQRNELKEIMSISKTEMN